jgi:hypothetical protein
MSTFHSILFSIYLAVENKVEKTKHVKHAKNVFVTENN